MMTVPAPIQTWRDRIKVDPAADLFPVMSPEELTELGEDIKARGLQTPINLMRPKDGGNPILLDGRNRLDAMQAAGIPVIGHEGEVLVRHDIVEDVNGFDPVAFVVSANLRRRHLSAEQKRDLIAKLLQADPKRSDRATARIAKVDNKTVASVRTDLEGREEIPHVTARTDSKGRNQPAQKPARETQIPARRQPSADRQLSVSPAQERDKAIVGFSTLLHRRPADTLDDLTRLLRDERARIAEITLQKRVSLARGYLDALGVSLDDLRSIGLSQSDLLAGLDGGAP
jgi:ParB-like chromosome segregation protein Spo0J